MRDVPELKAIQALVLNLGKTIWCVGIGIEMDEVPDFRRRQNNFITKAPHGLVS